MLSFVNKKIILMTRNRKWLLGGWGLSRGGAKGDEGKRTGKGFAWGNGRMTQYADDVLLS